jgi:hypothetical protein
MTVTSTRGSYNCGSHHGRHTRDNPLQQPLSDDPLPVLYT